MTVPVTEVSNSIKISGFDEHVVAPPAAESNDLYRSVFKRWLDVALVLVSLIVVLPVVALLSAVIWASGGSPVYTQSRVGRGGRIFRIYKLRTMIPDSDDLLVERLKACPKARQEWRNTQKLKDDPRITPFGRFLRKTSLDELPQLLNVLFGDMSLVGPRPMLQEQAALYPGQAYYRLRPGVTGYWQISDRNECDFADRAAFDEAYDRSLSLIADLRVLAQTVTVVLRGTGY